MPAADAERLPTRGAIRHFWGSELFYAPTDPGQDPRHAGTLEPVGNLLDLTPEGRPGDWDEQLAYSQAARARQQAPAGARLCRPSSAGSARCPRGLPRQTDKRYIRASI